MRGARAPGGRQHTSSRRRGAHAGVAATPVAAFRPSDRRGSVRADDNNSDAALSRAGTRRRDDEHSAAGGSQDRHGRAVDQGGTAGGAARAGRARSSPEIPMQPASTDIWDKKYRLKTKAGRADRCRHRRHLPARGQGAGRRRADRRAAALLERALPVGAAPRRDPGRPHHLQCRRAGAQAGDLARSTAPSRGTIDDSMDGILDKVHEAGLTLKAGCGIGYEFSTLRPRGAYVVRRRRVHVGPDVVHGYLRQDVFHRVLGRRPPRRADGHVRRRPSRT